MKTVKLIILLFLLTPLFPAKDPNMVVLRDSYSLGKRMEDQNVFIKFIGDISLSGEMLYITDSKKGQVFIIDIHAGELIKTISSFGQGPEELQEPSSLIYKNGKVFVMDRGFRGMKIFSADGGFVSSFKCPASGDPVGKSFDVNAEGEIFIPEYHINEGTLVSVYSQQGKRMRGLVKHDNRTNDYRVMLRQTACNLRLDGMNHFYLLFIFERQIKKYDLTGKLIWERNIVDPRLDSLPRDDGPRDNGRGGVSARKSIFDMEIDQKGHIYVIHAAGGLVMNNDGAILYLLSNENPDYPGSKNTMRCITLNGNKLVNYLQFSSDGLRVYQLKEDE